ncbi:hypothetical protein ACN20G_08335 [Streptomyces sp. BI20]|uniref:hypothetical protein n=1 Tax=Streptomyces sp. BI20 TaxID=3403460 RepID=UPI003C73C070
MSEQDTSRHLRLRVDLVLEVTDARALIDAALLRMDSDHLMPAEERNQARAAVAADPAEALAYLVDPTELVLDLPGTEPTHASWSTEDVDHDPADPLWDVEEEDGWDEAEADEQDEQDEPEEVDEEPGADRGPLPDRRAD